jgi:predicted acyl esterase
MHRLPLLMVVCALLVLGPAASAWPALAAQSAEKPSTVADVRAAYTKFEYRVPMRDGARLFTAVYVP